MKIAARPLVPDRAARSGGRQVDRQAAIPAPRSGKTLRFGRGDWEVVGVMDAGQSARQQRDLRRSEPGQLPTSSAPDVLSSVLVRATDAGGRRRADQRSERRPAPERDGAFPRRNTTTSRPASAAPIEFLGIFVSIIMAVGSSFAAMNTMYAAVARRVARDRHAARAGLLARQHSVQLLRRIACCCPAWAGCWAACWCCR